jgi:iron(III) transport system ATP-binding protein
LVLSTFPGQVHPFVTDFVGASNLPTCAIVAATASGCKVKLSSGDPIDVACRGADQTTGKIVMSLRPERILIAPGDAPPTQNSVDAAITGISYQAARFPLVAELGRDQIRIESMRRSCGRPGQAALSSDCLQLFPTGQR